MNSLDNFDALARTVDESPESYICRICTAHDDGILTWLDVRDILNENLNKNYSESWYRKNWNAGNFDRESLGHEDKSDVCAETQLMNLLRDIKKERVKLSDERVQNNAYIRRMAREDSIIEIAKNYAQVMNKEKLLPKFNPGITVSDKQLIVQISDWHYGLIIDSYWNQYDLDICKNRVAKLLQEVLYVCEHEDIHSVHVVNLSDLIAGRIHSEIRISSRVDTITQIMDVSEILAEFLARLSEVGSIYYYDCLDNHSRVEPDKNESLDLESLARLVPWYLNLRFAGSKNIHICDNKYSDDIISFECNGFKIGGVHGDRDKPQAVVKNINLLLEDHYDMILTAHLHHFSSDEDSNTLVVSNGSLMGTDPYAQRLRKHSKPSQNLIVVSKSNVASDIRRVLL